MCVCVAGKAEVRLEKGRMHQGPWGDASQAGASAEMRKREEGLRSLSGNRHLVGCDSRALNLPLPRAEFMSAPQSPQCWAMSPLSDTLPQATHVEDDIAVFLKKVPGSPLGYRHHLLVLGEESAL